MSKNYYTEKETVLEQIAELRAAVADLSEKIGEILEAVRGEDAPMTAPGHRHSAPGAYLLEVTAGEFQTTRELQRRLDAMGVTHANAGAREDVHAHEPWKISGDASMRDRHRHLDSKIGVLERFGGWRGATGQEVSSGRPNWRQHLALQTGDSLDLIGQYYGLSRDRDEPDDLYRVRIEAVIGLYDIRRHWLKMK